MEEQGSPPDFPPVYYGLYDTSCTFAISMV